MEYLLNWNLGKEVNDLENPFVIALISYGIGNFCWAYILGKIFKKEDVRESGSKNAGATNALRVYGKKIGALAFILDLLKAILAVYIGGKFLGYNGKLVAGVSVVLGHNYPIFLGFKGGKGIAASIGVMLSLHWPTALVCILIGILVIIKSRYVSLGSVTAAALVPFIGLVMNRPFNKEYFITTLILATMAIYRHRSNIKRLLNGEE
ncbi:MAG: glycerol-3-phosphate 1-O-acyltransferase PlsY, partial [Tissierellia bacterium]|nr:glycerol-3-phosphate 1-O-acyltransferase PlsY [Tissierellia bacterium]